jgi:hypothetical protein
MTSADIPPGEGGLSNAYAKGNMFKTSCLMIELLLVRRIAKQTSIFIAETNTCQSRSFLVFTELMAAVSERDQTHLSCGLILLSDLGTSVA